MAKSVDLVILIIGLNKDWESESYDRPDMKLPGLQDKLIESVLTLIQTPLLLINPVHLWNFLNGWIN